jgi:hypothetical protein
MRAETLANVGKHLAVPSSSVPIAQSPVQDEALVMAWHVLKIDPTACMAEFLSASHLVKSAVGRLHVPVESVAHVLGQEGSDVMHSISRYSRSHELVAVSYAAMGTARRATRERARIMAEEREVRQRRGRASARVVVTAENRLLDTQTRPRVKISLRFR